MAVLPEVAAARETDVHIIPITRPQMRGSLALAWRSDGPTGPAARAFIRHARAGLPALEEPGAGAMGGVG